MRTVMGLEHLRRKTKSCSFSGAMAPAALVALCALLGLHTAMAMAMEAQQQQQHRRSCPAEVPGMGRRFIDISHSYRDEMPKWESEEGLGAVARLVLSMADGEQANISELKFEGVHSGTHVDAPGHFVQEHYERGLDVASLDLGVLIGPVLLVDAPRDSNLTAEALQNLHIPNGVERIIFRTLNTDRELMWKKSFDSSYVGFTTDGADWLVHHTNIKFVGTDYLSVAAYVDLAPAHQILLGKKLVLVEGLNLDDVDMGLYTVYCLPLKLLRAEGCPIRCVLST